MLASVEHVLPGDLRREGVSLVLPEADDVSQVASLLVQAFYEGSKQPPPTPTGTPQLGVDGDRDEPVPPTLVPPRLHDRWRTACRGLRWRLGARLQQPTSAVTSGVLGERLAASLETSLLVALHDAHAGGLVACAEVSLRPIDGRLPGEFAVPPLFQLHAGALGAYLSNLADLPSYRRRGLASHLLRVVEWVVRHEWRLHELYLHVDLRNEAAARLYADYTPLPQYDDVCRPPNGGLAQHRYHRRNLVRAAAEQR
jgi:ribosomal protein S18 acetylase RimI-like enzyme